MPLSFRDKIQGLKGRGSQFKREFATRVSGYIIAGLGLVAGLAWNDAIKGLIEYIFPIRQESISAKFLYAGLVTIIVVIMTLYIVHLFSPPEEPK